MARKNSISKKEEMEQVTKINEQLDEEIKLKNPPILKNVGGSIANLPIKTPEYKKWIEMHKARNGMIGHEFIQPAPELGTKYELGEDVELKDPDEIISSEDLNSEELEVDPTSVENAIPEQVAPIIDSTGDKYIDLCIIENSTRLLLGRSLEDIENDAAQKLREYHEDGHYETLLNIKDCIEFSKQGLLENGTQPIKEIESTPPIDIIVDLEDTTLDK